jgi:hypothetical protein
MDSIRSACLRICGRRSRAGKEKEKDCEQTSGNNFVVLCFFTYLAIEDTLSRGILITGLSNFSGTK